MGWPLNATGFGLTVTATLAVVTGVGVGAGVGAGVCAGGVVDGAVGPLLLHAAAERIATEATA